MNVEQYRAFRSELLENNCVQLIQLEENTTKILLDSLCRIASNIKRDFDKASELSPYWQKYAPVQRGHKPRGEAYPWGEVGEKVIEGYLYSLVPQIFNHVRFIGAPYGHDIRFVTDQAFIHIDAKSTGPTDDPNEVVSSPNQVTGNGKLDNNGLVFNDAVQMRGARVSRAFQPELAPFYIIDNQVKPTLTYYLKVVYAVNELAEQPLDYIELICVPNGLALFDGPNLQNRVKGLLTPGKDEVQVVRKRTRIKLDPLAGLNRWRCQKIKFDQFGQPFVEYRL